MIPTVTGYKYLIGADVDAQHPHGDLDRIEISGRCTLSEDDPLYGEPVAWIDECLLARNASLDNCNLVNPHDLYTFERRIDGGKMNAVTRSFNAMNAYPFVDRLSFTKEITYNRVLRYDRLDYAIPGAFMGYNYSETVPVVSSGDPFSIGPINTMSSYMGYYFNRGVMNVSLGSRHGPSSGYAGTKLEEVNRVEVVYAYPHTVDELDGDGYLWYAAGNGGYYNGSWKYAYVDWRIPSGGSVMRISATEEKLRYVDYVRPVFLVRYYENLRYSDEGSPRYSNDFRSVVVGGATYRFDANGTVTINAADAFRAYNPGVSPHIEGPYGNHGEESSWTLYFYEQIDSVWLVATMKPEVCDIS